LGKKILSIILVLAVLAAIVAGIIWGGKILQSTSTYRNGVGAIDQETIFESPEFKNAQQALEKKTEEYQKIMEEKVKAKASPKELQTLERELQEKLNEERNKNLIPLMKKAQAAIGLVAQEHKLNVILDTTVAVAGVPDISNEVLTKMRSSNQLDFTPPTTFDSQVAYFDQDVLLQLSSTLPIYKKLDSEFNQIKAKAEADFKKKINKMPEAQAKELYMKYVYELQQIRLKLMEPIVKQIEATVEKVAQKKNLALVLRKEFIMYGGQNITEDVVKELIGTNK